MPTEPEGPEATNADKKGKISTGQRTHKQAMADAYSALILFSPAAMQEVLDRLAARKAKAKNQPLTSADTASESERDLAQEEQDEFDRKMADVTPDQFVSLVKELKAQKDKTPET